MCGICGFIVQGRRPSVDGKKLLGQMARSLAHRGPDQEGRYCAQHEGSTVGLGHRRLSIIDLSEKANQPLGNEDQSIIVVFNGEIYNYVKLARELKANHHIFQSRSDTEVIVHLYEDCETQCVDKLDGMFAFALLDKKRNRLVLARDRMGIKPLFYALKGKNLYFSSEIKSLLQSQEISRQIDLESLDSYLTFGYIPGERTIFQDIKKLPPASHLVFENGKVTISSYWSIDYLPKISLNENEIAEHLDALLNAAVQKHLISDVPLGAFLSGGIDSSIIVALMHKVGGEKVSTYSLGYTGDGQDELEYAAAVADYYGTSHQEFKIRPEMTRILPELLWYLDEPFFDNSILPTYYISKFAREEVKVVLSGDGGDELFGGYEWTRRHQYQKLYRSLPGFLRKAVTGVFAGQSHIHNEYGRDLLSKTRRIMHDLSADVEAGFQRRTTVSHDFRQALYSDNLKSELVDYDAVEYQKRLFQQAQIEDEREKMLYVDTMSYLPDDCLFKVDRMSMAHGLEVRVPFLDKDLVEFSARIPFEYKIKGLTSKYILKKTFAPYLPPKNLKQRKQGFTVPISAWLRNGLGTLARDILLSESMEKRDLFNKKYLEWMLEEHKHNRQEFGHRIWSLVIFELWARLYLDDKIDTAPNLSLQDMIR
jgi:asparagine synthase (glutamine-hydrolysing)